jgi:hypothetical protein
LKERWKGKEDEEEDVRDCWMTEENEIYGSYGMWEH